MREQRPWSWNLTGLRCEQYYMYSTSSRTDGMSREKEREQGELEAQVATANKNLQAAQTSLASLRTQAKAKQDEIKSRYLF